jgi:hypothetical protein
MDLDGFVTYVRPDPNEIAEAIRAEPHEYNRDAAAYVRARHHPDRVAANIIKLIEGVA